MRIGLNSRVSEVRRESRKLPTVMYGGARGGGKSPVLWIFRTIEDIEYARRKRKCYRKARYKRADARMIHRLLMQFALNKEWNGKRWL